MCSYFEPVNNLQYSREPQNDREPFDGDDDGYDYQDPIPTMANNFTSDVSTKHGMKNVPKALDYIKVKLDYYYRASPLYVGGTRTIAMHCGALMAIRM